MTMTDQITDRLGRVFDPAKHLHRDGVPIIASKGASAGCFMPRGGRRKKADVPAPGPAEPVPAAPATAASDPPPAPAPEVAREDPKPPPPPTPSFDDLEPLIADSPPPSAADRAGKGAEDRSEADADIVCRVTQAATGLLLDPEEARPSDKDHRNLVEATAAIFRQKGWQLPALLAGIALGALYFLSVLNKPKSRAKFESWRKGALDATPPPSPSPRAETGAAAPSPPSSPGGRTIPPLAPTPYSSP